MSRWVLESLQLVNWGGYDGGPHVVELHEDLTLLTGGSGTGKSTLLDAYLVLISDSSVALNGASNDVATGRARGDKQRNVLNYIRGRYDTLENDSGTEEFLLRPGDAWGAIAATYRADVAGDTLFAGEPMRFTAMRVYYAGEEARSDGHLTQRRFTIDAAFDLARLEEHVDSKFAPAKVKAANPGLQGHETYGTFVATLVEQLGIGTAGGGADAVGMLGRIQSGGRVESVAGLYRDYVLEAPGTIAKAEDAVRSFDEYQASKNSYETAMRQRETLAPIREAHRRYTDAQSQIAASLVLRPGDPDGPLAHWIAGQQARRAELHTHAAERAFDVARRVLKDAEAAEADAATSTARAVELLDAAGGGKLKELETQWRHALQDVEHANWNAQQLERLAPEAFSRISDEESFTREQQRAQRAIKIAAVEEAALKERELEAHGELIRARTEAEDLSRERQTAADRKTNLPGYLIRERDAMAAAAGLSADELPFVGELLDMKPDEERWRVAADSVLSGLARVLVVDEDRYDAFRDAIDGLRLGARMRYWGVRTDQPVAAETEPGTLADKLQVADGPFRGWLAQHLVREADHLCVETARELVDDGRRRVALSGQERAGRKGAHGSSGRSLGFDSRARVAELTQQLELAHARQGERQGLLDAIISELSAVRRERDEAQHLQAYRWQQVDVAGEQQKADLVAEQLRQLRDGNAELDRATRLRDEAIAAEKKASGEQAIARRDCDQAEQAYDIAMGDERRTEGALQRFAGELDPAAAAQLDAQLAAIGVDEDEADRKRLEPALQQVKAAVAGLQTEGERASEQATHAYETAVKAFQKDWPEPSIGTGWRSYSDYLEILERHEADRSEQSLRKWNTDTITHVAGHLSALYGAYAASMREIRDRLDDVNEILEDAPFGARDGTLQMVPREKIPLEVRQLKARLSKLGRYVTLEFAHEELDRIYSELAEVIGLLRADIASDRRRLLDVRHHMAISAGEFVNGVSVASHTSLGQRSGGETQELVAFILGAALRYQLGAEEGRPRFSAIILDEAFIKADSEFTSRSVEAWRTLGFQLIVGAPLDKGSTLEKFAGLVLVSVKDADHSIRIADARKVADVAA